VGISAALSAATERVELHHRVPCCLLTLREKADAGAATLDGAGLQAWLDYEQEAMRWGVNPDVSPAELAALVDSIILTNIGLALGKDCSSCILGSGGAMERSTNFYAHTPVKGGDWHDLVSHLEQTAAMARINGSKFGAGKVSYKLREAREELGVGFSESELVERAGALVDRVSIHLPFLGKVRGRLSVENVVDMLENARRRIMDQGRYDDGVARLYRTIEMWHQWRLQKYSVSTEKVDWEKIDKKARERFLKEAELTELPGVLALRHARLLDHILSGINMDDEAVLRDLLQKRNRSILGHGLEPIEEKVAKRFLEYLDAVVEELEVRSAAEHAWLRGH
jgi:hypothetical protein